MKKYPIIICALLAGCRNPQNKRFEKETTQINTQKAIQDSSKVSIATLEKRPIDSKTYSFGLVASTGDFKLIVEANCYDFSPVNDNDFNYLHKELKGQQLYFIHKEDTIKKVIIPTRTGTFDYKGSSYKYSKNEIKFLGVIENNSDFIYYLSGGEDNVQNASEYYSFYSKEGILLWEVYLDEKGNYEGALKDFDLKKLTTKDAINLYRTFPLSETGTKITSSLIKPIGSTREK